MRVVFAGTPAFSVPALEALIAAPGIEVAGAVSQPDRPAGRGMRLTASPVKQAAEAAGIEVITPERLRGNDEALAWLESKRPDLLVVIAFGMILPKPWLDAARVAPVNVHASLLPRWRGAAPIERALLAGDDETGVCLMQMEEGLDTGGIYASATVPITAQTTGAGLWRELSGLGAALLLEHAAAIADGSLGAVPQDDSRATYAAKLTGEDRLIDWQQPAAAVDRQVRTFSPKPGARTRLEGKWIKLVSGAVADHASNGEPGSLIADGDTLLVVCGDGSCYRVETLQPEGKQAMAASAFLRGARIDATSRFR